MGDRPRLLITLGDVAGVGPEIVARAWPDLVSFCSPTVVGAPSWIERALCLIGSSAAVRVAVRPGDQEAAAEVVRCIDGSAVDLTFVQPGRPSAAAGQAAHDFLCRAIDLTLAGEADGIVTAPLNKEGLHLAGLPYPGHTEILAARTRTKHFGMLLYSNDLAVIHVTLHLPLREIFAALTMAAVEEKTRLLDVFLRRWLGRPSRIGVAALNPHASDGGMFGDEEERIIRPGVDAARAAGVNATGPWPADTLFARARHGEFDGVVAMYHDQGHIAMKLWGARHLVNVSVGLPLVRTSVAHGTGYDIAGRGVADPGSLIEAARVAARLVANSP